jgi:hypothetical protein
MRRIGILLIAGTLCSQAAFAVDREFNDIVQAISVEFGTRPLRIPFFGLVNAFTFVVRPAGTSHIDLAVFEKLNTGDRDGRDLQAMVRRAVGRGWTPFIQVHSRRSGSEELVLVYMRMEGRSCRLIVTSIERGEATVVQLKLNPDGLQRWISSPRESAHSTRGSRASLGDE